MINFETMQILNKTRSEPDLTAKIKGNKIEGNAYFWGTKYGVVCLFDVYGLPTNKFLELHIHEGGSCSPPDTFADAGSHYNPNKAEHPNHAGDLPPLYSNQGHALSAVLIDKFTVHEIVGRTVVIHSQRDDFSSQPAGDSGVRIACGVIK